MRLISRFLTPLIFVCALASAGHAQPTGDSGFCALADQSLLTALNGSWTISQGPGTAMGGGMTIPLPPQKPAPVVLAHDPEIGVLDIDAADLSDGMVMFPTATSQIEAAKKLIGKQTTSDIAGCDWYSLPILIGTNYYYGASSSEKEVYAYSKPLCEIAFAEAQVMANASNNEAITDALLELCKKKTVAPKKGAKLEMTLILRFDSDHTGSGMVYFDGQQDKIKYSASAPVHMSR